MKRQLILTTLFIIAANSYVHAQQKTDTIWTVNLRGPEITDKRVFSDSMLWRYNQLKNNVKVILPYLAKATQLYSDASGKYGDEGNKKAKRKYLNRQQEALRDEFKDKLKNLTVTQGKLLVKLISRQTGKPLYDLVKEYENGFTAMKWQTWARLNGYDLREQYDPQANHNLEHIMREFGYPLPEFYASRNTGEEQ